MLLTAVVSKAEIQALVVALTPVRISIDGRKGRAIELGRAEVELVPGHGLRLRGDARITWDVAGVAIPVTLDAWQVLLVPRVTARGDERVVAFEPLVEALDLKHVPAFLCGKITAALREGIGANRGKLAWSFATMLSRQLTLPSRLGAGSLALTANDATVAVGLDAMTLTVSLDAAVRRNDAVASAPPAPASGARIIDAA